MSGAEEDFGILSGIADRLFGDDTDQKERYIGEHMKKLGYRVRAVFEDPEPDDGGNGGGSDFTSSIFGGGQRQRREVRDAREGRRDQQRRASGGGFGMSQYQ